MLNTLVNYIVILLLPQHFRTLKAEPLVYTNVGMIRGMISSDGDYSMYLGIPYAKVEQNNPFGTSIRYPAFDQRYDAFDDSVFCPQLHPITRSISGSIDCLRLNVYVPSSATYNDRLPVMVWIHGGGFNHGLSGRVSLGPKYLIRHNVIVVTLSYRSNVYGFMCLDMPNVPGNQGLKDQYLALEWISENISAFGGNPDELTLFGVSAGADSIDLHLKSTKKKLFNKVIIETGSSMSLNVLNEPDKLAPFKIAQYLGYQTNDINKALLFLSHTEPHLVVSAFLDLNMAFNPCAETEFDGVEPFLTQLWINSKVPNLKNITVVLGFNEFEFGRFILHKKENFYKKNDFVTNYLSQVFNFDYDLFIEMKDIISHFYYGDEETNVALQYEITKFMSDTYYIDPMHRSIRNYLNSEVRDVFLYMFSYVGGRNNLVFEDDSHTWCCASHGDEMNYVWDRSFIPHPTASDMDIIDKVTTMWSNFAKYSDPTPQTSDLLPVKWKPLTDTTYNYLKINTILSLKRRPYHKRMAFWELFYRKYAKYNKFYNIERTQNNSTQNIKK